MKKLYYGGDIITMEEERTPVEAVLVEDGKIAFKGTLEAAEKQCTSDTERIDLKGKTLMPSFIDPHGHISMVAQFSAFANLSACRNFDEMVETLKKYKEDNHIGPDGAILGCAYDHNFLEEHAHPTKQVLNQVSTDIPVFVIHTSVHMGAANSALLALAGITEHTKDPQGGKFGRDSDGSLNGYVEETPAIEKILRPLMARIKTDPMKLAVNAQEEYVKYGITTVQDGAVTEPDVALYTAVAKAGKLKVDVVSYVMTDSYDTVVKKFEAYNKKYHNRYKIGGAKIVLDGSPQGRSAWLTKPYEGEAVYKGYPTHTDEEVEAACLSAVKDGHQLLAHCNGDAASDQFIRSFAKAVEAVPKSGKKDFRPVMIHCQTVRDDQLDQMAELKMIPSVFVAHTYYWGDIHLKNLGPVRGAHISPVKAALEHGLVYNFHQDPPVVHPDMMHTVWCAVNRVTRTGQPIGQDQCIGVYEALKGITINAAYAYFEENNKGSIKEGKLADLVILDANPLKAKKEALRDIKVLCTIKEGEVIYQA